MSRVPATQFTNQSIVVQTSNAFFEPLDSGFRRNDEKEQCPKFVSPAKTGVRSNCLTQAGTLSNDARPIMDSLVIAYADNGGRKATAARSSHQTR
jgi:hypothetical protein